MALPKGLVIIDSLLKLLINSMNWLIKHWYVPLAIIILIIIIKFLFKELEIPKLGHAEEDPKKDFEECYEEELEDPKFKLESPEMEEMK